MYQREIYAEAIARIDKRRQLARLTQEQHTDQIRQEFPEAAEVLFAKAEQEAAKRLNTYKKLAEETIL